MRIKAKFLSLIVMRALTVIPCPKHDTPVFFYFSLLKNQLGHRRSIDGPGLLNFLKNNLIIADLFILRKKVLERLSRQFSTRWCKKFYKMLTSDKVMASQSQKIENFDPQKPVLGHLASIFGPNMTQVTY